ncbi:hypothetical protein F7734_04085 [Scytonema sp. UIC 10036]|uniref:hypothetical protein n=1 Tax=Scytonema sp. UIC 10036 TaxID=2304196 RepID=UPI0012DAEB9E|nr:hypothetical protein [Scytonema sp. UIC 10036]MUG91704.1 hypothetical protein [Scytonema sp. UIC 10036]
MLRIIRKKNSRQGQLLEYLKVRKEGGSDLAMIAITSYYLPDCLYDSGVRGVELQRAVVDAIAQLEAQILKLKYNYGMGQFPQVVVINPIGGVSDLGLDSTQISSVANVNPNPAVSFFGNEATTATVSTAKVNPESVEMVSLKEESFLEEDLDDDDGFFDDDSDVILPGSIEGDAGFRLA